MPLNLTKLLAGDTGQKWFDKFNATADALMAGSTARDASDATINANLSSAVARIAVLESSYYRAPVGSYVIPAVGGQQIYAQAASPWTTATSLGRLAVVSPSYHAGTESYGDVWDMANGIDWTVTLDGVNNLVFRRIQRVNGVPQVQASLSLPMSGTFVTTYTSWITQYPVVVSAVALSPTAVRLVISGSGNGTSPSGSANQVQGFYGSYIVTWDGAAGLSQINTSQFTTNSYYELGYGNRRGYLLGSTSTFVQVSISTLGNANSALLYDRGNSNVNANLGTFGLSDWLGGGYRVVAGPTTIPSDATNRVTVALEQWGDQGVSKVAFVRLTGYSYSSIVGVWALSGTLVVIQFKDANSSTFCALFSVDVTKAAPLGLMGIYNSGYLGSAFGGSLPAINYGPRDVYLWRVSTALACRLSRVNYSLTAPAGLELTCMASNDVAVTLGAGVPGITAATVLSAWQCAPDTLAVLYAATATTAAVYLETYQLA